MALALLEQEHERDHAQPFRAREGDLELQKLLLLMFIDTHNTGFYVNSYTTKVGVGMAEFMKHMRAGIERLEQEIADEETQIRSKARSLGSGPKSLGPTKRAAQLSLRINTAYTKCKHVGGSELVFPILFGAPLLPDTQVLECLDENGCLESTGIVEAQHREHPCSRSRYRC